MNAKTRQQADYLYLLLGALFVAALVTCNLIANKFITIDLGFKEFVISAGVLPYPITFLFTDLLSEIYGKKKTNRIIIVGFVASIFVLGILWLGNQFDAISGSPLSNELYETTFGNSGRIIGASMLAYISAQFIDVKIYHFWKDLTKGKMLWLRNNGSTIFSQLIDTTLVILVIFYDKKALGEIGNMIIDGWLFKTICALLDTPIIYLSTWLIRKKFNLKFGQELNY